MLRARQGFTMIEMVLSMTLMLTVIGLSSKVFRKQADAVSAQSGVLDAQQNSRYALSLLERELRVAGVGVIDQQPLLVMANTLGITFNANLVSLDTGDLGSVYVNPDADSAAVDVLRTSERIILPGTAVGYPDTTYMAGGNVPSNAETISYWLSPDSTVSYNNEYVLWRRVNARPPKMVARGIVYNTGDTVFRYFKSDSLGNLTEISKAALPLIHTAPIHGTPGDTSKSALTDSIKQVKVQLTSVFHDPKLGTAKYRRLNLTIKLMNAGLIHHITCGNPPIAPTNVNANVTAANGTTIPQTYVTITWSPSVDDGAGEKDVERYAIYRRLTTVTTFDLPIGSMPGGKAGYSFTDTDVQTGQQWVYAVASQDCTPAVSSAVAASSVTIP
jgi:hypothetical protein